MLIYLSLKVTVYGEWAGGREGVGGTSGCGRWGCDEGQQQVVRRLGICIGGERLDLLVNYVWGVREPEGSKITPNL